MRNSRIFPFCTIVFSLFCTISVWSQEPPKQDFLKMMRSDAVKSAQKNGMKIFFRSYWDGNASNTMSIGFFQNPEFRKGIDMPEEQFTEIQNIQKTLPMLLMKHPEFAAIQKEQAEFQKLIKPGDMSLQNADEETMKKFNEFQQKIVALSMNVMNQEIDRLLTPQQKKKIQEAQLAAMSEMPMISSNMLDVLDLSDGQKEKISKIKKELDPQFDQFSGEMIDDIVKMQDKIFEKMAQNNTSITDPKELQEKMKTIMEELQKDEDFKKLTQDMLTKGKGFVTQAKFKMFDVLTDEQMARLQNLIDNPSEYVKQIIAEMKKKQQGNDPADPQAFLRSWKPGEPIPAEYKEKRKLKSFPTNEE